MGKRANSGNIQARHNERQKKRKREQKRRKIIFYTVLALIAVLCIMYFTPIFNIKKVEIAGNERLKTEDITKQIGEIEGKNLFSFGEGRLKRNVQKLSYVNSVSVKKKLIPPTVIVDITEREPAMQTEYNHNFVVMDKTGRVLTTKKSQQEGIILVEGAAVASANKGRDIAFKDKSLQNTLLLLTKNMEKADILKDVTSISLEDSLNIKFNYQGRLDVICGSDVDLQRKLALFKEAINSNKLTENSRGTINLSTEGKAIYTP